MSDQPQDLETAILKWVNSFPFKLSQSFQISTFKELSDQPKDLDSLSDGIILTEIMSIMYNILIGSHISNHKIKLP